MGAWIETASFQPESGFRVSHPVWVRGLKQQVDPTFDEWMVSHPVWVRGLKLRIENYQEGSWKESHPVWVRGLKRNAYRAE